MTEEYDALRQVLTDNAVAYHPAYARIGGSVTAGILLAQLMYWTRYSRTGWVFRTQAQIENETALTEREQNGARRKLRERGLIIEKRRGVPAQLYYQPQFDAIRAALEALPSPTAAPSLPDDPENTDDGEPESAELEGTKCRNLRVQNVRTTHESEYKKKIHVTHDFFSALAALCSINLKLMTDKQRGQLNTEVKKLADAGVGPDDLRGFGEWWRTVYWKGKDGQAPRPSQVREDWGQYEKWQQTNGKPGTIKTWVS